VLLALLRPSCQAAFLLPPSPFLFTAVNHHRLHRRSPQEVQGTVSSFTASMVEKKTTAKIKHNRMSSSKSNDDYSQERAAQSDAASSSSSANATANGGMDTPDPTYSIVEQKDEDARSNNDDTTRQITANSKTKLLLFHDWTVCMVPPPSSTTRIVWDALNQARQQLADPGFYRWPPHANLLYPFLNCYHDNQRNQ
jgi:2'-5' RNA ligase superfamily